MERPNLSALKAAADGEMTGLLSEVSDEKIARLITDKMFGRDTTIPPAYRKVAREIRSLFQLLIERVERAEGGWLPIADAPRDGTLFLAACDDGRMMIVRGSILWSMKNPSTPDHLQFPATHFRYLPDPPSTPTGERG